jgi:hypothetical protein
MAKTGSAIALPEPTKPLVLPVETATLVNITNIKLPIAMFTYGNYTIPFCRPGIQTMRDVEGNVDVRECEPGEEWAAMKIQAARGTIDYGEQHRNEYVIHGREIALDLARMCNSDLTGFDSDQMGNVNDEKAQSFAGIFLADGDEPTQEELLEMRDLLRMSDGVLVAAGHRAWDQFGKPDVIHEGYKRAARRLGVTADWLYSIYNVPDCPHCGSKLKSATATVCATCHRDLPERAAIAAQNAQERTEQSDAKPRKGRKAAA